MAFSRLKHPLRGIRKKIYRTFGSVSPPANLGNPNDLDTLLRDGVIKLSSEISDAVINKWKNDYFINRSSYIPSDGNITFPFYNREMHELLKSSNFISLIGEYFQSVYHEKPILQKIPSVVITYPTVSQQQFDNSKNHFPAGWHIDYPYEFTVHIPLEEISLLTSHTKYISGSQYRLTSPSLNSDLIEDNNTVVDCLADAGDILCLDVEGWHRAQLERNSYRAMIQLKFTAGNDLLYWQDSKKSQTVIQRSVKGIKVYGELKERLKEDLKYIESLLDFNVDLKIMSDNKQIYKRYLEI